jgi:hypothetical protein
MRLFYITSFCLGLLSQAVFGQSSAELTATLKQINGQLKPVASSSESFEQLVSFESLRPYLMEVSVKTTDKKGQSSQMSYAFNLADIDPASVAFEAKKELMVLTIKTKAKQAFIGQRKNDVPQNNVSQFTLYGTDADNARTLADLFKKAAPLADKQFTADVRLPSTYDALVKWIATNTDTSPTGGSISLQQSVEADKANPLILSLLQTRTENGKSTEQLYVLNAADLMAQPVNLDVDGSLINVEVGNKDRFIRSRKNGQWGRTATSASLACFSAHKARMMQMAWQKLLPLASKLQDDQRAKFVQYANLNDGLKRLANTIKPADDGDTHIEQILQAACLTTLTRKTSGKKSQEETFRFHWSDLDGRGGKLQADGGSFKLTIPTKDKGKWITTAKNSERGAFDNSIEVLSNDLEAIRFVPALLEKIIPDCQKTIASSLPTGGMAWVAEKTLALKDPKGQMSYELKKADDKCAFTYTTRQNTGKKTNELSWDIKLADLDPQAVTVRISGNELSIDLATVGKEKIVKAYKDGQPTNYANQLSIPVSDLELARPMAEIWRQAIAGCRR